VEVFKIHPGKYFTLQKTRYRKTPPDFEPPFEPSAVQTKTRKFGGSTFFDRWGLDIAMIRSTLLTRDTSPFSAVTITILFAVPVSGLFKLDRCVPGPQIVPKRQQTREDD
jgi:hypothetical protein